MLAHKPGALRGPQGQIELFRQYALGNFRDLLLQVAQDPAMLVWLDGKSNTKAKPQENFGREIMELFTVGVGNYTESDVYAAARVFTGWNLRGSADYRQDEYGDLNAYQEFVYNADQHDTGAKTFSFPIYSNGSRTIPARSESAGMQDGIDLITALAMHPETAPSAGAQVLELLHQRDPRTPDPAFVESVAAVYLQSRHRDQAGRPLHPHLALVHQSGDAATRAIHGRRSSSCARSRKWAGRTSRSTRRDRRWPAWAAALRAAERRRMAARRRLVLDGDDAGADEFRRHARRQPEGVPRRDAGSPMAQTPQALLDGDARSRDAGAIRFGARSRR